VRVLLDTVAFIHALSAPQRLGKNAAATIENHDNLLELSSISVTEIAIKSASGKIGMSEDVLRQAFSVLDVHLLPYTVTHALMLFSLPEHHRDPFDRQLIAQAVVENIPVITADRSFSSYKGLRVIW
jgi:PIN domain nuclease of toxin-antitoxin system